MTRQAAIERARTRPLTPKKAPPPWLDAEQLRLAESFQARHSSFIQQVLGTSSLAATFAAQDITPILMQTRRLPSDFTPRMQETRVLMNRIMARFSSREAFLKNSYTEAVALGALHQQVAEATRGALKWNPKERLPMNQQSFAFVLYTFAWWPIEALVARKMVDPVKEVKELDAWFHYWSVLGHGMGVDRELLPQSFALAKEQVAALRQAQYVPAGAPRPEGIPTLLGGQVRFIATQLSAKPGSASPDASVLEKLYPFCAQVLFSMIQLSPELPEALGLEKNAMAELIRFTKSRPA